MNYRLEALRARLEAALEKLFEKRLPYKALWVQRDWVSWRDRHFAI